MSKKKKHHIQFFRHIPMVILLCVMFFPLGKVLLERWGAFTAPYYTEETYKYHEDSFNRSQYRLKHPTALIPDEAVFSYAAGAYLHGVDPILINSEHTPLGKYFLALSILMFKNDKTIMIFFAFLTLVSLFALSKQVLGDTLVSLVPVSLFAVEQLFVDQLRYVPLLDIVQLPFIFFSLSAFLWEQKVKKYPLTALLLGVVMATKTIVPGILLSVVFVGFFIFTRRVKDILQFVLWLPLSVVIFCLSYMRTFMSGYTIWDFIGFQKWIFLYQKSKILFPFSAWRLIFFNQWQAWWGDFSILKASDWRITWPIGTILTAGLAIIAVFKKIRITDRVFLLLLWIGVYGAFLSIGVISSRFLLPFLPVTYILGTVFVMHTIKKK